MQRILTWLGSKLRGLVGLILPVFSQARSSAGVGQAVRWVLHLVILAAILVGLYFLGQTFHIEKYIPRQPLLRKAWLPILFLLVYALCWLSWWLWKLLVSEEEPSYFPDIDAAWEAGLQALHKAGLGLTDLPLFLILGQAEEDEKALFQATALPLKVRQTPPQADAPVHVYATPEAIYVTCPGASVLGRYATSLAGKSADSAMVVNQPSAEDSPIDVTLRPQGGSAPVRQIHEIVARAEREGRVLSKEERRELRRLNRRDNPNTSFIRNAEEISLQTARLKHLCRLIVRDRHPYCALNGTLVLIPFAGTDSDQDATDAGDICQRDLAVTRTALKVHCPLIALVCDLETAPGFAEFVARFNAKERLQRIGQRCPLLPDLKERTARASAAGSEDPLGDMLDSMVRWICKSVVPGWVYKKFQLEEREGEDVAITTRANSRLFLFFDDLSERQKRLASILRRGLEMEDRTAPLLFGGCYLAGTGNDPAREQAFVAGVFKRLIEGESTVYWTDQTLAEEALYQRWINIGWLVLLLAGTIGVALLAYSLSTGKTLLSQ
jgi:hypothetical protein